MKQNYILSTYDNTIMNKVEETNDNTQSIPNNVLDVHYDNQYIDMLSDIIIRSEREIFGHLVEEFNKFYSGREYKQIKKKFLYDNYELKIEGWIDYTKSGTYINISYAIPSDDGVKRGFQPKYNHIVFTVHPTIKQTPTYNINNNSYIINRIHFNFMDDLKFWPPMNKERSKKGPYLHKNTLPLIIYDDGRLGVRSTNCEELNICLKHDEKIKLTIMITLCSTITKLIGVKGANLGSLEYNEMRNYNIPNNIERINNHIKVDKMINMNMRKINNKENGKVSNYNNNNNPTNKDMRFCGPNWFNFYVDDKTKKDYYIKMKSIASASSYNSGYFRYVGPHYWEIKAENGINYDKCYHGPFYGPLWNGFYINDTNTNYYYPDRYGKYYKLNTIDMGNKIALGPIDLDINKDLYIISNPNNGDYSWEYVYHTGYNNKKKWLYYHFEEGEDYLIDINNEVYFRVKEEENFMLYQDLEGNYYKFYPHPDKMKKNNKDSYKYFIKNTPKQKKYKYGALVFDNYDYNNKYSIAYNNCKGGTKNKKNNVDFKTYTVVELKHMCKYYNIKNYSKLNKSDLIKVLKKNLKTIL